MPRRWTNRPPPKFTKSHDWWSLKRIARQLDIRHGLTWRSSKSRMQAKLKQLNRQADFEKRHGGRVYLNDVEFWYTSHRGAQQKMTELVLTN